MGFSCFKKQEAETRLVYASQPNADYPDNEISNTKYNLLSFVPKNLMEQFRWEHKKA